MSNSDSKTTKSFLSLTPSLTALRIKGFMLLNFSSFLLLENSYFSFLERMFRMLSLTYLLPYQCSKSSNFPATTPDSISPTDPQCPQVGDQGKEEKPRGNKDSCQKLFFLTLRNALSSVQFICSSCLTLCDPMNHSTPGLPVHHQLLESTQTHVHWAGDAIQPSHPLSSPFPPALNLSQHQGLFKWVSSSHQVWPSKPGKESAIRFTQDLKSVWSTELKPEETLPKGFHSINDGRHCCVHCQQVKAHRTCLALSGDLVPRGCTEEDGCNFPNSRVPVITHFLPGGVRLVQPTSHKSGSGGSTEFHWKHIHPLLPFDLSSTCLLD